MSGQSSPQTTTTTQEMEPWVQQQPYLQDLFQKAQEFYNAPRPDYTQSSQLTQQGIGELSAAKKQLSPLIADTVGTNQFLLGDVLRPESNPALQEYINLSNQAITKSFAEDLLPQLTGNALATGNIGSSRQGVAEGLATGKALEAIERNTANLTTQGYSQGLNALTRGLALAPGTATLTTLPGEVTNLQAGLTRGLETQDTAQEAQFLQAYQGLINGNYGGTSSGTTTAPGPYGSPIAGAAGGALIGWQATGNWWGAAAGALVGAFGGF